MWSLKSAGIRDRHCHTPSMTTPPPLPDSTGAKTKLHNELSVFFIVLGLLLAVLAYFSLSGISDTLPPLWGFPRHLAIGVPIAILSGLHLASGAFLVILRSRFFCVTGAIASTFITVFYCIFMFSATGTIPINLMSIVIALIPILVWSRVKKYLFVAAKEG